MWPMAAASAAVVTAALALSGGLAYASTSPPPANIGNTSVASGNQVLVPMSLPLNMCGVSIAALGSARSGCTGGSVVGNPPGNPGGPIIPGGPIRGGNPPGTELHKHHKHHKTVKSHEKAYGHHKRHAGSATGSHGRSNGGSASAASSTGTTST